MSCAYVLYNIILNVHTYIYTHTQVSTWFANARRRMKKASQEEEEKTSGSEDATPNEASGNSDPEDDRQ